MFNIRVTIVPKLTDRRNLWTSLHGPHRLVQRFLKCDLSVAHTSNRTFGGQRRVVPPAGEPKVRSPELI